MEKQPIIAVDRLSEKPYGVENEIISQPETILPLSGESVKAIYEEAGAERWRPEWKYDKQGNKVGYERVSIDAWCE